ncbi:hypothetical protein RE6C_01391 [Rhodopirellula europaea 6C]|uniref:Uncharacterized protein n=2 Tax=Rhodopirellula TaxID=265488 RepID=M2A859_9BACT|nr:hypothetical protein RE6C_01391 [Rhodopirellula europaea 6C]
MVVRYWTALTPDSVVAVVTSWPDRPAYKEVLLACRDAADEPTQKTQDGG